MADAGWPVSPDPVVGCPGGAGSGLGMADGQGGQAAWGGAWMLSNIVMNGVSRRVSTSSRMLQQLEGARAEPLTHPVLVVAQGPREIGLQSAPHTKIRPRDPPDADPPGHFPAPRRARSALNN